MVQFSARVGHLDDFLGKHFHTVPYINYYIQETGTEQKQKTTSLQIICPPSPSFARFCVTLVSRKMYA